MELTLHGRRVAFANGRTIAYIIGCYLARLTCEATARFTASNEIRATVTG